MRDKQNVILFVVDSVRYYSTGGLDDRDKLEMMDRFEKESIYFPLTVSSAPSSVMSLSSMLTSLPAYYIARNYDDFRYDNRQFISLHTILERHGYQTKSLFNARELRFYFGDVIPHVEQRYWPKGITNNQQNWSNSVMNQILEAFLRTGSLAKPFFMILWYNVRLDPKTSELVEEAIEIIRKNDLWDDSVFLLAADHGYMDPRRGYTPEKLKELGLSHDLVMSDDNIRIPFYLRYPDAPTMKVEHMASTLDFLPTILSLLGIGYPESSAYRMYGLDLLPLVKQNCDDLKLFDERKIRCDARFFAQADRSTALRDARFKYIIRPDKGVEEFYDTKKDACEKENLIDDKSYDALIKEFREFYRKSEEEIINFQQRYLLKKLSKNFPSLETNKAQPVAVLGLGEPYFLDRLTDVFEEFWPKQISIDLIVPGSTGKNMANLEYYRHVYSYLIENLDKLRESSLPDRHYGILIILTDTRNAKTYKIHQEEVSKIIKYQKRILLDPNMEFAARNRALISPKLILKVLKNKKPIYFQNPELIFSHFLKWLRIVLK